MLISGFQSDRNIFTFKSLIIMRLIHTSLKAMRTKNNIFIIFIFLLTSCGDNKDGSSSVEDPIKNSSQIKKVENFALEYEIIVKNADLYRSTFRFNNTEDRSKLIDFFDDLSSSSKTKKLKFNFDEKEIPTAVYLGLGNETPTEIIFNEMKILYKNKILNISIENIQEYFDFNKFVTIDITNKTLVTNKVGGEFAPSLSLKTTVNEFFMIEDFQ